MENLASIPISLQGRGFEFSPFPGREGGRGLGFALVFPHIATAKEVRTLLIAESLKITWFLLSTQHTALSTLL